MSDMEAASRPLYTEDELKQFISLGKNQHPETEALSLLRAINERLKEIREILHAQSTRNAGRYQVEEARDETPWDEAPGGPVDGSEPDRPRNARGPQRHGRTGNGGKGR